MAHKAKKNGNGEEPLGVLDDVVTLPIVYEGLDSTPVLFANQFVAQYNHGEFIITIGQTVAPPLIGDTLEERREQAKKLTHVACRILLRIGLTPDRMRELVDVLGTNLKNYEKLKKQEPEA